MESTLTEFKPRDVVVRIDDASLPLPRRYRVAAPAADPAYLILYPFGGGFQSAVPAALVRHATGQEINPPPMFARFTGEWIMEGDKYVYFRGITFHDDWNGWTIPWFDQAEATRAMEWFNAHADSPVIFYDSESGRFYQKDEDGQILYEPTVVIDDTTYHNIGSGWCWETETNDQTA